MLIAGNILLVTTDIMHLHTQQVSHAVRHEQLRDMLFDQGIRAASADACSKQQLGYAGESLGMQFGIGATGFHRGNQPQFQGFHPGQ